MTLNVPLNPVSKGWFPPTLTVAPTYIVCEPVPLRVHVEAGRLAKVFTIIEYPPS